MTAAIPELVFERETVWGDMKYFWQGELIVQVELVPHRVLLGTSCVYRKTGQRGVINRILSPDEANPTPARCLVVAFQDPNIDPVQLRLDEVNIIAESQILRQRRDRRVQNLGRVPDRRLPSE